MYKIEFSDKTTQSIKNYTDKYLNYYEDLYKDSGIWSHEKIIEGYVLESFQRYNEIADVIEQKLSSNIITYKNNEAIIRWRSKILLVSFREQGNTRTITNIEIR